MTKPARRTLPFDATIAVVLGTAAVLVTAHFGDALAEDDRSVDLIALTLVAVAFAALSVRRRWPLVALATTTATTSIYLLESYPYGPILLAFFIAVYTVASRLPLRTAAVSVAVALAVMLTHVFVHPDALGGLRGLIPGSAWAVVPFAIGTTVRLSREAAESARAEGVRQQLYEERIRLAEEVHDIVGHGLAAIQMQADVALHVDEHQSPRTKHALRSISQASSEAFEELRDTLDVVSDFRRVGRRPAPGLADIEELCGRMRRAGVRIDLSMTGDPGRVPAAVEHAAYRVVQEALTNVARHGAEPVAQVNIAIDENLTLLVTNPGPTRSQTTSGRGIRGMRRRAESLHGRLTAAPTGDGFEVRAEMPLGATT